MNPVMPSDTPAIAGGQPAKTTPYGREERYGAAELQELTEALAQGSLFYAQGKKVRELETEFAKACGLKYGVACSSGTAAIHAALMAAEISPGDEVIVTPISDMGSVIPILWQGAVPVFADLDPCTYELDPDAVEAAITPRTRAVLAVHLWGNACDLTALDAICKRHDLVLIEDCAQAQGCTYLGKPIGAFGAMACFSLNEYKLISCGDGGIVLTDDPDTAEMLRLATDKAYNRKPGAALRRPAFLAGNYRMTELQGAVAIAQLKKLDRIVARRRAWCAALSDRIRDLPGITVPKPTPGCDPSWCFYMVQVEEAILGADAGAFASALSAEGLPAGAHYIGTCLYEFPIFANHSAFKRGGHAYVSQPYAHGLCPTAERILANGVMLSVNEAYTETDLEETVRAFHRVATWFHCHRTV